MRSKRTMYNISSTLLLQVVVIIYGLIVPRIIIGLFGSDVNGLISSVTQFLSYITLLDSGMGPVVKAALYKPIAKKDKYEIANILKVTEKFFKVISYIFIFYLIILAFVYPLIVNNEFEYFYTLSLIVIISISTFFEYYFGITYRLYLQAEQKSYVISLIQIITYIVSCIVIIIMSKFNCSVHVIKLVSGLIFIFRPILQNLYVKKKYNINLKDADKNYKLEKKWDGLTQHLASVIHGSTDVTILTFFCSLAEVSIYSVYFLVVKGIKSITQAFVSGIDSIFGDMLAKDEQDNLNKKFVIYEVFYNTIITIVFTATMILIVPFISVYTKGVTDVNYIRPLFGYLIVISEYIWAIRLPYSSITLAAGHFKETKKGAWVETISNILISIIFVSKFGLVGVTVGTIVAMFIRTIEFMYHTNKHILNRNVFYSFKNIPIIALETLIIIVICKFIPFASSVSYLSWLLNAICVLVLSTIVVLVMNLIFYGKELNEIVKIIKSVFVKKS